MSAFDWLTLAYWLTAAFFCAMTWIDVSRTYYVYGPPSGILTGLFWPVVVLAVVVMWLADPMRPKMFRRAPDAIGEEKEAGE